MLRRGDADRVPAGRLAGGTAGVVGAEAGLLVRGVVQAAVHLAVAQPTLHDAFTCKTTLF